MYNFHNVDCNTSQGEAQKIERLMEVGASTLAAALSLLSFLLLHSISSSIFVIIEFRLVFY